MSVGAMPDAGLVVAIDVRKLAIVGRRTSPARCCTAPDLETPAPDLVDFHGGGLVARGLDTHDTLCRTLAREAGVCVVVDDRLASKRPFPAGVDALRASRCRLASGFLIDAAAIAADLVHDAPQRPLEDRRMSSLRADDLAGLPATVLYAAGLDVRVDEGRASADGLAAGVVRCRCRAARVLHLDALDGVVPAAKAALAAIGRDTAEALA